MAERATRFEDNALGHGCQCSAPALSLVGDLEDSEHLMTKAVAQMRDAIEIRFDGVGHINAFLASDRQLPHVEAFLARH